MQTMQTQIRLLLKEQSDQGLHCSPSIKYFKKQLHKKQNLSKNMEKSVLNFKITVHVFAFSFRREFGAASE